MMVARTAPFKTRIWMFLPLLLTSFNGYYWIESESLWGERQDATSTARKRTLQLRQTTDGEEDLYGLPQRPTLLIAQFAANLEGPYGELLNLTRPINMAYANKWDFDYTILLGTPFDNHSQSAPDSRATYSKLVLLQNTLLEEPQYDRILILDADALVYDFDRDINTLLPEHKLLLAHPTRDTNHTATSSLNIGVTLWNLRHERLPALLTAWKRACLARIARGANDDDQAPLQQLLQTWSQDELDETIEAPPDQLLYRRGVMIKHMIRSNGSSWSDVGIESRAFKIKNATSQICAQHEELAFCEAS